MSTDYHTALLPPPASADISSGTRGDRIKKAALVVAPLAFVGILAGGYATGAFDIFGKPIPETSAESGAAFAPSEIDDTPLITRELIEHIKSKTQLWQPVDIDDFHPYKDWTLSRFRKLQRKSPLDFDYVPDPRNINDGSSAHPAPLKVPNNGDYGNLPKEFDARVKWPNCQSIHIVRDQGACGSCWAFGSVSAMSDRVCIHSNGSFQQLLSPHDLMGCCAYCSANGQGCEGGDEASAYHFWMTEGLVTGDLWQSNIGCQPYPIEISIVHVPGQSQASPTCQRSCTNSKWKNTYGSDKVKAKEVYRLPDKDEQAIMFEIMTNGPVSASYTVYDDFPLYKNGVYEHTTNKTTGSHVIVILGWGEDENGNKYWLCKNSWNRLWSDMAGFFKIKRGVNECDIETGVIAGIPDVATLPKIN